MAESTAVSEARKQAEDEAKKAEELADKQRELAANPDLVPIVTVGDVPETLITNAMSKEPGFPARKAEDGELIEIVRKINFGSRVKLIDNDDNEWEDRHVDGLLVEWDDDAPTFNPRPMESETKSSKKAPAASASTTA